MARQKTAFTVIRDVFYWCGVIAALACVALVLSSNTQFGGRFEHAPLPLSWLMGLISIAAFIGAEVFGSELLVGSDAHARSAQNETSRDVIQQEA
jgi:hypothetical protein